jgi:hypothetical protein
MFETCRKIGGKPERIALGRYPDLSIENARSLLGSEFCKRQIWKTYDYMIYAVPLVAGKLLQAPTVMLSAKSLGHKTQQATAIYARLNIDPVRKSVERATSAMMGFNNIGKEK